MAAQEFQQCGDAQPAALSRRVSALNPPRSPGRENKFSRRSLTRRVGRARTDDDRIMSPGL